MTTKTNKTKSLIYIALFITLIYVTALMQFKVFTVPFTLQTLAVMLTACFLGAKRGLYAVLIYIFMGLAGIPVFAKGGGFFYILEHTFGYILAFIPAVIFIGYFKDKVKDNIIMLISLLFCSGIIMLFIGALYAFALLSFTTQNADLSVIVSCYFLPFLPAELLKSIVAALLYGRLKRFFVV